MLPEGFVQSFDWAPRRMTGRTHNSLVRPRLCYVPPEGLEPSTFWSEARRSIQLS